MYLARAIFFASSGERDARRASNSARRAGNPRAVRALAKRKPGHDNPGLSIGTQLPTWQWRAPGITNEMLHIATRLANQIRFHTFAREDASHSGSPSGEGRRRLAASATKMRLSPRRASSPSRSVRNNFFFPPESHNPPCLLRARVSK